MATFSGGRVADFPFRPPELATFEGVVSSNPIASWANSRTRVPDCYNSRIGRRDALWPCETKRL